MKAISFTISKKNRSDQNSIFEIIPKRLETLFSTGVIFVLEQKVIKKF